MCDHATLDRVLRLVVKADELPTCPKWPDLMEELADSGFFPPEYLESSQDYIIQKFGQLQIERVQQHTNKLLGKPAPPKPPSNGGSTSSEVPSTNSEAVHDDSEPESSDKDSETDEEGGLYPTLDEEANSDDKRTRLMSVYLNRAWEGAVLKYCNENESFVSLRFIARHHLEVVDGHRRLTWKWDGSDESHMTEFLVRETLESDFILGKRCSDEEFNRENESPASKGPRPMNGFLEQPPMEGLAQHPTQTWVNQTVPNTKLIGDLVYQIELNYRHQELPYHIPYTVPLPQGGIVGEESHSSASSVPKRGSESGTRSRKSKTHRSNSKSTK